MGIFSFIMRNTDEHRRHHRRHHRLAVAFDLTIDYQHLTIKGQIMAVTFNTAQFVIGTLQPVDANGASATYTKGSISFASSDTTIFTALQDPTNELAATLTAVGVGTATLLYQGKNLAGQIISGTASVTVVPVPQGDATQFLITFSEPQPLTTTTTSTTSTTTTTLTT
jgi:hypothetical protein